jgi:hypothetical protein
LGLKDKMRRLEHAAKEELITFELQDGTMARFPQWAFTECFLHEYERGRRHYVGEDPGPAHPMVDALQGAKDLKAIVREYGTMMRAFVDEDAVMRGEAESPGPPVKEIRPGHYE